MTKSCDVVHTGPVLSEHGEYSIITCETCGFAHCLPIPPPEELSAVYAEEYYSSVKPDYIRRVETDRAWHDLVSIQRLDRLEALTTGRRLLEVGSSSGFFLDVARKRGWDVQGFEPSRQAWQYSTEILALPVYNEFFSEETARSIGSFDAIYLALVLEHVPDPLSLMRVVKSCLNPGGAVCVAVPNDFSVIQRNYHEKLGGRCYWLAPPHHINYFSHESLKKMLTACGFIHSSYVDSSFPLDFALLMGLDYTDDAALGRKCHSFRMSFEKCLDDCGFSEFRTELYALFAKHGIGREVIIYATRP